ncbi:hypothetical protein FB451DRAFT_1437278 [Mycena latifolia]|nr:hypothetical protein FB451DRAFT_1437278 [Mycena latifolia]
MTHRLFGPVNRPLFKTNVRHHAVLRKAIEVHPPEHIAEVFHQNATKLHVAMGSSFTFSQFGKIKTDFMCNGRLVSYETDPLDIEAWEALRTYRDAYDTYFMSRGNDYAVRDPAAQQAMQAAEQAWHIWIVAYRAARGMPGRPGWALEPLPGLQRVHVPHRHEHALLGARPQHQHEHELPHLHQHHAHKRVSRSPGSVLIDLSHIDDEPAWPAPRKRYLGEVEISDDEDNVTHSKENEGKVQARPSPKKKTHHNRALTFQSTRARHEVEPTSADQHEVGLLPRQWVLGWPRLAVRRRLASLGLYRGGGSVVVMERDSIITSFLARRTLTSNSLLPQLHLVPRSDFTSDHSLVRLHVAL